MEMIPYYLEDAPIPPSVAHANDKDPSRAQESGVAYEHVPDAELRHIDDGLPKEDEIIGPFRLIVHEVELDIFVLSVPSGGLAALTRSTNGHIRDVHPGIQPIVFDGDFVACVSRATTEVKDAPLPAIACKKPVDAVVRSPVDVVPVTGGKFLIPEILLLTSRTKLLQSHAYDAAYLTLNH